MSDEDMDRMVEDLPEDTPPHDRPAHQVAAQRILTDGRRAQQRPTLEQTADVLEAIASLLTVEANHAWNGDRKLHAAAWDRIIEQLWAAVVIARGVKP